jgi:CIC family chloride channel protein
MAKLVSSSLTIGSGGSAGDFAPSLAIGGLFGGAFGRAAQLMLHDPRIDPGAFALVGMGVFYGGIAHVPLSALVLVCELAGNYDLLVPLMLAQGIAFVALRKRTLYEAQVPTLRDSPVHQEAPLLDLLKSFRVDGLVNRESSYITLRPGTSASDLIRQIAKEAVQTVFPVVNAENVVIGLISADDLRLLASQGEDTQWLVAADLMQSLVTVDPSDNLRTAAERMLTSGLRELPVVDETKHIVGYLNETDIAETYLRATIRSDTASSADRSDEMWTAAE